MHVALDVDLFPSQRRSARYDIETAGSILNCKLLGCRTSEDVVWCLGEWTFVCFTYCEKGSLFTQ